MTRPACLLVWQGTSRSNKRSNIMRFYNNYSFSIYLSLLLIHIFISKDLTVSSSCQTECGNIKIPYPFGIKSGCYLDNWYEIECRNATFPFLVKMGMEVVDISIPGDRDEFYYKDTLFGAIRIKSPITSVGCSRDGIAQSSGSVLNMTDSPFFFGKGNRLVAVGCNLQQQGVVDSHGAHQGGMRVELQRKQRNEQNHPFFQPDRLLRYHVVLCV